MHQLMPRTIEVLRKYARDSSAPIEGATTLASLEIDRLDLPMVVLDIEDVFDVHVRYDDDIEACVHVEDLVALVSSRMAAKRAEQRIRASAPRIRRSWLSTQAA